MNREELIAGIELNVLQGRRDVDDEGLDEGLNGTPGVAELVEQALQRGIGAREILLFAVSRGMDRVGDKYESGEFFLPDMLSAAEAVGVAMEILEPYLSTDGLKPRGKVVIATVQGDLHDIGKNIVSLMLRGAGYKVSDLGSDVGAEEIVEAVRKTGADLLGLSALLTTTMPQMQETIERLKQAGLREKVKVMVGGAPLSEQFAEDIGADAYGHDALEAVRIADHLVNEG